MYTQEPKHNPFITPFWLNFVNADKHKSKFYGAIELTDLVAFPRNTQLLLAHLIQNGNPQLELLSSDADVSPLVGAGWVIQLPSPVRGIVCFKVKTEIWKQLNSFKTRFLDGLEVELFNYRKNKTASYPWVW